jgi:hypothetical protein
LEEEFCNACKFFRFDDQVDNLMDMFHPKLVTDVYGVHSAEVSKVTPKFELLCPHFGWAPADTIKRTFDVTTHYARGRVSDTLKQHWRSWFPACNVKHCNEPVVTELNQLELWGAYMGNACLKGLTKEKVYIITGLEFGYLEGHTLIFKALYGLRSSGVRWHERFADVL